MKKLVLSVVCGVFCATIMPARTTTFFDDCVFCGGGAIVIEDEVPTITIPPSDCVFCGNEKTSSGGGSSSGSSGFGTGWSKAATKSIYLVDSDGKYAGLATISTSKKSSKGKVSVKIAFKLRSGKNATASKSAFAPDEDNTITAKWSSVKNIGDVELMLTPDGDASGSAGIYEFADAYESDDDDDDGVFMHGAHVFSVEADDYEMPDEDYELIDETVPTEVEITTSSSKNWNCGKTPSIKYKKFKEDGETWYELIGLDDEVKTNYSGLKLKYNSKKGTFSGSFKVYATNEASIEKGKPKLKSYSFSVSGHISGGSATGVATCKKLKASWTITIE